VSSLEQRIAAHLARAEENLRSADLSLEAKLPNAATSRFYYAAYHAAIAFILKRYSGGRRQDEWDHRVVGRWFAEAARSTEWPSTLADLLAMRHRADYIPVRADREVSLADARDLGRRTHRLYDWVRRGIEP
jgi:uncharacterized protein (UPF0332 family)